MLRLGDVRFELLNGGLSYAQADKSGNYIDSGRIFALDRRAGGLRALN